MFAKGIAAWGCRAGTPRRAGNRSECRHRPRPGAACSRLMALGVALGADGAVAGQVGQLHVLDHPLSQRRHDSRLPGDEKRSVPCRPYGKDNHKESIGRPDTRTTALAVQSNHKIWESKIPKNRFRQIGKFSNISRITFKLMAIASKYHHHGKSFTSTAFDQCPGWLKTDLRQTETLPKILNMTRAFQAMMRTATETISK